MDETEIEHRLTEVENRSKSNTKRLDEQSEIIRSIQSIAVSVNGIAIKQEQIGKDVSKLSGKVDEMEKKPGKRYEELVEKIALMVVAAVVTYVLSHIGL